MGKSVCASKTPILTLESSLDEFNGMQEKRMAEHFANEQYILKCNILEF